MSTEFWAAIGTSIATLVFVIPGVMYAYYVLESWIEDPASYERIIATVESRQKRTPSAQGRPSLRAPPPFVALQRLRPG